MFDHGYFRGRKPIADAACHSKEVTGHGRIQALGASTREGLNGNYRRSGTRMNAAIPIILREDIDDPESRGSAVAVPGQGRNQERSEAMMGGLSISNAEPALKAPMRQAIFV